MNELLIALMWTRCVHCSHPSTLYPPITFQLKTVSQASPHVMLIQWLACHSEILWSLGICDQFPFSSSSFMINKSFFFYLTIIFFFSCSRLLCLLKHHATFHSFIHLSYNSLVSIEKDWLCVHVCIFRARVCKHSYLDLPRGFTLMPEMTCIFKNCLPAPHLKWDRRRQGHFLLRLACSHHKMLCRTSAYKPSHTSLNSLIHLLLW